MAVIDWSDPCARHLALQAAYYGLLQGGTETMIRYRGPEGEREVRYAAAKLDILKAEVDRAAQECAVLTGTAQPRRRFAIRAGARWDITS